MYAGNTEAKGNMCISTHFVFPCSTYQCKSKGSSIQYYNFIGSVVSEKLSVSAEGIKEAVIRDPDAKEKIRTHEGVTNDGCRGQLKCDGTHTETRFRFSAKWMSPFKSAGGRQFCRLLAAEVCALAVVMLDTPCSEVV